MENAQDPKSFYIARQERVGKLIQAAGLDYLALNPGPSLVYLTGLHFHLSERPTVALFQPDAPLILVLPELEKQKIAELPYVLQAFSYGDNPQTWKEAFRKAAHAAGLDGKKVGVEPGRMRFLELRLLESAAHQAQLVSAQEPLTALRMQKDAGEVAAMRKAVAIAQEAFLATIPMIKPGVSERQIASELTVHLLRSGSQSDLPFAPIVSTGSNSPNPHATPSERRVATGDLLVIDWGAAWQGYVSDLTRTLAIGQIEPEFERIYQAVLEANAAGRRAARPGIPAGEVDHAARKVIDEAGYGQYFTHRVGHGIGMEGHEEPYMFGENQLILKPGMAFTIEPGIYLPGRGGVRIEDNVVITETGSECLSDLRRELWNV